MLKVLVVFGTRPEAIKMAPLVRELKKHRDQLDCKVAVTAQHREMMDQVLRLFELVPDYDLNVMRANQTLFELTGRALAGLREVLQQEKPDLVLVHGDTTTTFVGALAAYYLQIPVGHVEAGLRTYNKYSPFPEEINRRLTGALADLHFAPTAQAKDNLLREGVPAESVLVTGNTVIDALLETVRQDYTFSDPVLKKIDFTRRRVLVTTAHRRENLGAPLENICLALKDIALAYPDVDVVFPVHKNPLVRQVVEKVLRGVERVHLIEPLDYQPFAHLIKNSYLVLSDSGGLQEEAPALGKPVLVLRDTTERPEAVEAGTVRLVGAAQEAVCAAARRLLDDRRDYARMANVVNPYGDGYASRRIVQGIRVKFSLSQEPVDEFALPETFFPTIKE